MLIPKTSNVRAAPGNRPICGAYAKESREDRLNITPHEMVSSGDPMPRKLRLASAIIAIPKPAVAMTRKEATQLGAI
tara:strand:+ start:88 stop:318 length:231 start_codon:yes stop_codon:yes gene_type:complete